MPQQEQPDPDFPTVAFPNPEEPGALDLSFALAARPAPTSSSRTTRTPIAARSPSRPPTGWRMLRGDEVGVLLADALLRKGIAGRTRRRSCRRRCCARHGRARGCGYAETLTGFKWIARAAPDLAFGYEEALGYAVAPTLVRDKDGISAALLVAELAAGLKPTARHCAARLDELAAEFGRYATDQVSVRVDDLSLIADTMRAAPRRPAGGPARPRGAGRAICCPMPTSCGSPSTGGRVVVRPSGTEPKLKAYLEVVEPSGSASAGREPVA